jgi:hypothetical protein
LISARKKAVLSNPMQETGASVKEKYPPQNGFTAPPPSEISPRLIFSKNPIDLDQE